MIVRSPYQATTGKNLALKANGNGYIRGIELGVAYNWDSNGNPIFPFPGWRAKSSNLRKMPLVPR